MDTKTCFKCDTEKPLSEFYKHKGMADGRLNKCKACARRDVRLRRVKHPEETRAQDRAKHERYKEKRLLQQAAYRELKRRDPEWVNRRKANNAVANAIRDGRLVKPDKCEACSRGGRIEGHHADYSKPLEVDWLCPPCHRRVHFPIADSLSCG